MLDQGAHQYNSGHTEDGPDGPTVIPHAGHVEEPPAVAGREGRCGTEARLVPFQPPPAVRTSGCRR